jgi:two-component system chemotaxis sensor kinase CheA
LPSKSNQPNPVDTFLQEADELLAEIESAALSLSPASSDSEDLHRIFRAFHTIKGSGAMFGFDDAAGFTHHVESLLDQVREGLIPVSSELSSIILASTDCIKSLLQSAQGQGVADSAAQSALLERVHALSATAGLAHALPAAPAGAPVAGSAPRWNIRFRPDPALLSRGCSFPLLFRDLKKLGPCVLEAHTDAIPPLAELTTNACHLWWTAELTADVTESVIRDVFMFVEDGSDLTVEPAKPETAAPILVTAIPAAAALASSAANSAPAASTTAKEATIRVPAARLDRLVNLVGELVMNHSRLSTAAARFNSPELAAPVEEIERLVDELRDDVLQIRMMPIGTIFGRFRRLVHDLSQQLGKEIDLVTEGEDTELDKSILDQLAEPLVHLLRNSIDHGIELPDVRVAKGKPRRGSIRLVATHRGSDVVVRIEDDGAGIDRAAVRAKAVSRQLIAPDANLSDKEILNLILLPGFSTAQAITSISGRGVGMDVVKRQIDALRGDLSLSSEPGRGACVALTLPLTLAIIDGLLVESGDSQYILPMAAVTENVELPRQDRVYNNGRNLVAVRGQLIPYVDLREVFEIPGGVSAGPVISKIVLVRYEDQRVGLVVDRVMGTHQTVIQSLGRFFRKINVVSGSTVMGDGRVALILDIPGIVRLAELTCREQAA